MLRFSDFAGNQAAAGALQEALRAGRLPHALVLEGPAGSGKRTLARIFAAAALCLGEGEKPCGTCAACRKVEAGSHPDLFTASGGAAARSFHVETIRFLRRDAYIRPNEGAWKLYLLFRAESMSEQAQNALLKILEEPPPRVCFVLTCASAAALLPTVRSRARILRLAPPPLEDAARVLRERLPDRPEEALRAAAAEWGGNVGRALEALEGTADAGRAEAALLAPQMLRAALEPGEFPLVKTAAPLAQDRELLRAVLDRLCRLLRDACVLRAGGEALLPGSGAAEFAAALTRERLMRAYEAVSGARRAVDRNANTALLATCVCISLRRAAGR